MSVPDSVRHATPEPSILLITGAPASGKSWLARSLAAALPGFALVSKDALKETLYDTLHQDLLSGTGDGPRLDALALSALLSRAAMELLWTVARGCPQVILEANFRPHSEHERDRILALPGRKLELYCHCRPKEARRRFAARAARRRHHPAHSLHTMSAEMVAEYDRPVGVCPVIPVDTTKPVNSEHVLADIQSAWPDISCLTTDPQ